MKNIYSTIGSCIFALQSILAQQNFSNFQAALLVIGQPNFTSNIALPSEFIEVSASCSDLSSKGMYAVGSQHGRVLIYNSLPAVNGASASVVVGKSNFTSMTQSCSQSICDNINGVIFSPDGKKLIASDFGNNRVLIWNTIPTTNGQNADLVIGQSDFMSSTAGVTANKFNGPAGLVVTPDGKLLIADMYNNRVLIFNKIPTNNGASADLVIGQTSFSSAASGAAADKFYRPFGLALSPDGKLLVSDYSNHRVLLFNSVPLSNGASANAVIGQTGYTGNTFGTTQSTLRYPMGLACSPDGKLAISEWGNHRVLIYNSLPTANGAAADVVLGQPSFTIGTSYTGGVSAQSMYEAYGVNFDLNGRLFVNGRGMARTMVFGTVPTQTAELAINLTASSASLCLASEIEYTITIQNNGSSVASNVVAIAALPKSFNLLGSVANAGVYNNFGYWVIPSISSGASVSLILTGTVNTGMPQLITAYARIVNSQQFDSNMGNNGVSADVIAFSDSPPTSGTINGPTSVCAGQSIPYSINGSNGTGFIWSASNAIVSGTGSLVTVTFGTSNAKVLVLPFNASCTGSKVSHSVTVAACAGFEENEDPGAKAFPNPGNGIFRVESIIDIDRIEVFDLSGKLLIAENNIHDKTIALDLSFLSPSLYFLRVIPVSGPVSIVRIMIQD